MSASGVPGFAGGGLWGDGSVRAGGVMACHSVVFWRGFVVDS